MKYIDNIVFISYFYYIHNIAIFKVILWLLNISLKNECHKLVLRIESLVHWVFIFIYIYFISEPENQFLSLKW